MKALGQTVAGRMNRRVSFDRSERVRDGYGGGGVSWTPMAGPVWAEFRYERGRESEQAGAQTGTAMFKVRIRRTRETKAIDASSRMTDLEDDLGFNVREVDAVTDRGFIWLVVESGVAI